MNEIKQLKDSFTRLFLVNLIDNCTNTALLLSIKTLIKTHKIPEAYRVDLHFII